MLGLSKGRKGKQEMDSAVTNPTGRKYPGYTTAQLKSFIADGKGNPVMVDEVRRRDAGESLTLHEIFERNRRS